MKKILIFGLLAGILQVNAMEKKGATSLFDKESLAEECGSSSSSDEESLDEDRIDQECERLAKKLESLKKEVKTQETEIHNLCNSEELKELSILLHTSYEYDKNKYKNNNK